MKNTILCCDWGTTSLRIRLVNIKSKKILSEVASPLGNAKVFDQWKSFSASSNISRIEFFLNQLNPLLDQLSNQIGSSIEGNAMIISGMSSSSIGMIELAYSQVPYNLNGEDANIYWIDQSKEFPHDVLLISGVCTDNDVMRGEEVQLLGMESIIPTYESLKDVVIIMPGTHSKHVRINQNRIVGFNTFITGELFALMSQNGLLKEAVKAPKLSLNTIDWQYFIDGVNYSGEVEMLQALFKVRINELFQSLNKEQNYFFLSGLLIGYELRSLKKEKTSAMVLCCQNGLFSYYKEAIKALELDKLVYFMSPEQSDLFTVLGQLKVYELVKSDSMI